MCVYVYAEDMVASLVFLNLIVSGGKVKTDLYTIKKKVKVHKCNFCDYTCKWASTLKQHNANKHDVNVTYHYCNMCDAKFKQRGHLTLHMADRHNVNVTYHYCNLCDSKFKRVSTLTQHMADKHNVNVQWKSCDICGEEFKQSGTLMQHKANKHDVNVTYHYCNMCDAQFKLVSTLKRHKIFKHGVNVLYHYCNLCDAKFKRVDSLTLHMKAMHEKEYQARRKVQENRVAEVLINKGWKEYFGSDTMPPIGYFKREHQIDFQCAEASSDRKWCRIDFVLGYEGGYVFLEVDENQHRFGYNLGDNKAISCDSKRMANVHTSLTFECSQTGLEIPFIYWLRYNPDAWHIDGTLIRKAKKEREESLCSFLAMHQLSKSVGIGYAFYDFDNDTGLDVLTADEFPNAFRDVVINLKDFEMCGMCESE